MKNWRYYFFTGREEYAQSLSRIAVFPVPHLLRMVFEPGESPDSKYKDKLEFFFTTGKVTVRGADLRALANDLAERSAYSEGGLIEIPGENGPRIIVEFEDV